MQTHKHCPIRNTRYAACRWAVLKAGRGYFQQESWILSFSIITIITAKQCWCFCICHHKFQHSCNVDQNSASDTLNPIMVAGSLSPCSKCLRECFPSEMYFVVLVLVDDVPVSVMSWTMPHWDIWRRVDARSKEVCHSYCSPMAIRDASYAVEICLSI